MAKRKCPHGKVIVITSLEVAQLGAWGGPGPWGLFVSVFKGGSLQLAEGTKKRMEQLQREAKGCLCNDWGPARCIAGLIRNIIPPADHPPR